MAVIGHHADGANVECRWDATPASGSQQRNRQPNTGRIASTVVDNRSMQFALKINF
jgi:hypothetical protein